AKRDEWKQRYTLKGTDYLDYRHVFRTFAWNEDGGLSSLIQSAPNFPLLPRSAIRADYTGRAGDDNADDFFFFRPRPAGMRTKYRDETSGTMEPPTVEVGIIGDDESWVVAPGAAYILDKYRCAITFIAPDVAVWFPWMKEANKSGVDPLHKKYGLLNFATALFNTLSDSGDMLRIRLTAGFEMDDSVQYEQTRQLDSSWPFDAKALLYMPRRFKYRDTEGELFEAAAVDDGVFDGPMDLYGKRALDVMEDATGHGSIVLR
ncbi:unnamed protein product, partial [marine sediment metagenome]